MLSRFFGPGTGLSPQADPFGTFQREMNRVFDEVFRGFPSMGRGAAMMGGFAPTLDVHEGDRGLELVTERVRIDLKLAAETLAGACESLGEHAVAVAVSRAVPDDDESSRRIGGDRRVCLAAGGERVDQKLALQGLAGAGKAPSEDALVIPVLVEALPDDGEGARTRGRDRRFGLIAGGDRVELELAAETLADMVKKMK